MSPSTTRRDLLRTATGLALGGVLAGCNQQSTPIQSTTNTTQTTTPGTVAEPRALVDVTRESYLVKAWTLPQEIFRFPKGDAVPIANLPAAVQDPVRTAIEDGRYTTTHAPNDLLDAIENVDLVVYDGAYYDVTHSFPTVTVRLDLDVDESEAPSDRTISLENAIDRNETLSDFLFTVAPYGTHNPPEPYETARLEPVIQDFIDRYDYIETPRGVGELVVSRTTRTPPHTIRVQNASEEALYGRDIRDISDYGPPTKDLVHRVLDSNRKTPGNHQDRIHTLYPDDVPREFARDIDHGSHYVRVEDTVYGFDTRHLHWEELPLEFDATVQGDNAATAGPVDIELSVQNPSDHTVQLQMTGVAPFGVLWAYGPDGERVLWNDAYEQTEAVVVENGTVRPERHDEFDLPSGQSTSATYRLGHGELDSDASLSSGTYEVLGTLWPRWPTYEGADRRDWRSQLFPYTLTIEVS